MEEKELRGATDLNNKIRTGDIILADWESDGRFDHTMVVTQVSFSSTLVSYHSQDYKNEPMLSISSRYPNATFYVYHIT